MRTKSAVTKKILIPRNNVQILPVLLEQFGLVHINTSKIPHRRSNTYNAKNLRLTLNIDFSYCGDTFIDDDAVTSYTSGGLVNHKIIDDLHSEVLFDLIDKEAKPSHSLL